MILAAAATATGGCALLEEGGFRHLSAYLGGGMILPGQWGDRSGSGMADVRLPVVRSQFCYRLITRKIAPATAAHLHRAPAGATGHVVLDLKPPVRGRSRGCIDIDGVLLTEIKALPSSFYIDVHNANFPNGALRGQLEPDASGVFD